ncbi:Transposase [Phytophthora megakarya]|uniref:Transposase n=1 Tax=Phytophthora megakarya TaxID=4795 RepID=A0A225V1M7_9STRA|nr:Transposase [Phytophthora megakarya]
MYSQDFRWRAVFLIHVYGICMQYVNGVVEDSNQAARSSRWPCDVVERVRKYVEDHPTFYLEELQAFMKESFPEMKNVSLSTICRALHFDMNLSRKVLTKAARESVPHEVQAYKVKLEAIYSYPEQLLFIDETAKDGRHAYRRLFISLEQGCFIYRRIRRN